MGASSSSGPYPRLYLLDLLRGFLAYGVMFYHFYWGNRLEQYLDPWTPSILKAVFSHSQVGLELFFVLSGFVIALTLTDYPLNGRSVGNFILRRQLRLDPPYWAVLGLIAVLGFISSLLVPAYRGMVLPSLKDLFLNMFYLQGLAGQKPLLTVAWTLCLEVQFYLLFILLLWGGAVLKLNRPMLVMASLPLFVWCAGVFYKWLPDPQPYGLKVPVLFVPHWAMFYLGALACWAWQDRRLAPAFWGHLVLFTLPGLLMYRVDVLLRLMACSGLMIAALKGWLPCGGRCRPLLFFATLSYSLYLIHVPVGGRVINLLLRVSQQPLACVLWLVLAVVASMGAAWFLHHYAEVPAAEFARRFRYRSTPEPPPSGPSTSPAAAPASAEDPAVLVGQ